MSLLIKLLLLWIIIFLLSYSLYNPKHYQYKIPIDGKIDDTVFIDDKGVCYKYKKVYLD